MFLSRLFQEQKMEVLPQELPQKTGSEVAPPQLNPGSLGSMWAQQRGTRARRGDLANRTSNVAGKSTKILDLVRRFSVPWFFLMGIWAFEVAEVAVVEKFGFYGTLCPFGEDSSFSKALVSWSDWNSLNGFVCSTSPVLGRSIYLGKISIVAHHWLPFWSVSNPICLDPRWGTKYSISIKIEYL